MDKDIANKLQDVPKEKQAEFMIEFQKLYNTVCRTCQVNWVRNVKRRKQEFDYKKAMNSLCEHCKKKARRHTERAIRKIS